MGLGKKKKCRKKTANKTLNYLRRFWDFVWNDDSLLSWIVNIILAFVLIKFVIFPGLGFLLQTDYPIVAVISGSMEHDGSFDDWWESRASCEGRPCTQKEYYQQYGISKEQFLRFDYQDGFNTGDIMVLYGTPTEDLKLGDIVVFHSKAKEPIIHRIINRKEENGQIIYQTKGDHNFNSISTFKLNEYHITEGMIIGRAVIKVPYLGWIKIWVFNAANFIKETFLRYAIS